MATDESILGKIQQLVHEEQALFAGKKQDDHSDARLKALQVELDQCWDLLRQRRALREFGEDPDRAAARPAKIVENYEQ
jgi:hypothetical protein